MATDRPRILCVDDEPHVVEGLALNLRRRYEVVTACSGADALAILAGDGAFAVTLSDMRMPGMSGAEYLSAARKARPDTVRMLLTGQTDMQAAISAVNDGQIFRFLTKPCPPATLLGAFEAAVEQHRLITAERVLLEQTLHGSIKTLVDVLSLTSPAAFGRATRLKRLAGELAARLEVPDRWQVEVAAMLSQLGTITLPSDVVDKVYTGQTLSGPEEAMVARIPAVTEQLLGNIPRLESVRAILAGAAKAAAATEPLSNQAVERAVQLGARLLRMALDFDTLEAQANTPGRALDTLRGRAGRYDPAMLDALAGLLGAASGKEEVRELPLSGLRLGMVFADDVKLTSGALLCARGYEVTASFLARVGNFRVGSVQEPVRVVLREAPGRAAS